MNKTNQLTDVALNFIFMKSYNKKIILIYYIIIMESIESTLQFGHNQHIDLTMNTSIDIKRQLDTIIDKKE
jgi:hypothetical protein